VEPGEVKGASQTVVGRYALYDKVASGGMATVHVGRLTGIAGFSRTVAIKRLHPHLASDRDFVAMLLDEARLVVRVRHPNVVPVVDIVHDGSEMLLVMEYVAGEPLSVLAHIAFVRGEQIPRNIVRAMIVGVLHGLHAAHESTDEKGAPLEIVHRDVSPQNVLVGADGIARVLDFGIAKATGRMQMTRDGELKGKTSYMSPEQLRGDPVDRRTDVYATAVVLWELLAGRRLFPGATQPEIAYKVLESRIEPPSTFGKDIAPELDAIVMRGLARDLSQRFATARDMAIAIEELGDLATARATGEWVEATAGDKLREKAAIIAAIESSTVQRASLFRLAVEALRPASRPGIPTVVERPSRAPPEHVDRADAPATPLPAPPSSAATSHPPPSLPAPSLPPGPQRRWKTVALGLLVLLTVAVGAFGFITVRRRAPIPTNRLDSKPSLASATASVSARAIAPADASDAAPTATPPPPSASATPHPAVGWRGRPTSTARPMRPACEPPYTLDPRGIRIPKAECL
jgi:serine/threonine-protein kinase